MPEGSVPSSKSEISDGAGTRPAEPSLLEKAIAFLSSGAGLLILGFLLTSLAGPYLNDRLQASLSERERKRTLLEKTIADDLKRVNDLYDLSYNRYFGLQDILTAIKGQDAETVETLWSDYRPVVREWNKQLHRNRFVIEAIGGQELAARYIDFRSGTESLHFAFRHAHSRILQARAALQSYGPTDAKPCDFKDGALRPHYRSLEWPGKRVCEEGWTTELLQSPPLDARHEDLCRATYVADCRLVRLGDILGPFVENLARETYSQGLRP